VSSWPSKFENTLERSSPTKTRADGSSRSRMHEGPSSDPSPGTGYEIINDRSAEGPPKVCGRLGARRVAHRVSDVLRRMSATVARPVSIATISSSAAWLDPRHARAFAMTSSCDKGLSGPPRGGAVGSRRSTPRDVTRMEL
jgi:hypothetical protein